MMRPPSQVNEPRTTTPPQSDSATGVLARVAQWAVARRRATIAGFIALFVLAAIAAAGTLPALQLARFAAPGSPSVAVAERLAESGTGTPNLTLLVTPAPGYGLDDQPVAQSAAEVTSQLEGAEGVADVFSYWSTDRWSALRARDGDSALVLARMTGDPTSARARLTDLSAELTGQRGPVTVSVGGREEVFRQVSAQARADFGLAEAIVIPGVFILLLVVLRRPVAALLCLGLGVASVAGAMAIVRGVAAVTEVSTFAANLILVMGIALGVDYGLFVIARYHEARQSGLDQYRAAVAGVAGAGHTVVVSAASVAAALAALLLFPFPFLRSFAYAGIAVVGTAALASIIVLPALLAGLGRWVDQRPRATSARPPFFERTARTIMSRPLLWLTTGTLVVLILGAPLLGLRVGPPDDRILPPDASSRIVSQTIRDDYDVEVADLFTVSSEQVWADGVSASYATELSSVPGVAEVLEPSSKALPIDVPLIVVATSQELADGPYALVNALRQVSAPPGAQIGGYPAELADYRDALASRLLPVLGVLFLLSTLVLVVATRTVLLPVKAAVLNLASLSVLGGVLVWVFQQGHLAELFGVTATGTLDLSIPILMFCVAFGLSMDYEVLLLSRIIEEHRAGATLDDAVAVGLQRSAPVVTAAAGILAASFVVYLSSSLTYLVMIAVGMALVVALDATLIRLVMLPAAMKLMGRWNWWWPFSNR